MSIVQSKRLLVITGSPGTGKSTMAKLLATKLGLLHIDLHEMIENDSVVSSEFNKEKDCFDLDMGRVEELVKVELKKNSGRVMVLDSHVAHLLSAELMIAVIVMKCSNLKILEKRLLDRNYSLAKVKENLDSEIFEVCFDEASELGVPMLEFDTADVLDEEAALGSVQKLLKH